MQGELASAIAAALAPRLVNGTAAPTTLAAPAGTANLDAYELYLRGRWLVAQRNPALLTQAMRAFEQALALDPQFARGWAALANTRLLHVVFGEARPADEIPRARREAERALALDSLLAEGHATLAHAMRIYDFDWAGSLAEGVRAVALDPNDWQVRVTYGLTLLHTGRAAEALRIFAPAQEDDPRDGAVLLSLGRSQLGTGDTEGAVATLRRATGMVPRLAFAHQTLGYALFAAGRPGEALAAFRDAASLGAPRDSAHLAWALATQGDTAQARAIVRRLESGRHEDWSVAVGMAVAHEGVGERQAAFDWLERAWRARAPYLDMVGVLPSLQALRRDARWPAFAARLGLRG